MSTHQSMTDKALSKIAELIVQRMEELKGQRWEKPWFDASYGGSPQNITGRAYNGMNELILDFATSVKNHEMPVFLTFNQAVKEGIRINKGSSSIPILYYERSYKDANKKTVPESQIKDLTKEQVEQLEKKVVLRKFDVFNISDTNFKEVKPELYEQLKKQYAVVRIKDDKGMYANKELDRMFTKQEWLCPVEIKQSKSAFYTPSLDSITLPLKAQFKTGQNPEEVYRNGMEFYSVAIHEMAHSTGNPDRLNRVGGKKFGDRAYAKEELVAELTAALVGRQVGFDRQLSDNSAKYLNSWVGALRSEPRFVLSVLSDVGKASSMIIKEMEKQTQSLQQDLPRKSKSLLDLEMQYDRINSQYPVSIDNEAKRQLAKRISQAESIITAYHQNIEKVYGKEFLFDAKNVQTPFPKSVYTTGQKEIEKEISDTAIVKMRNGDFAVRGKIDGLDTGLLPIEKNSAVTYFRMSSDTQKTSYLQDLVQSAHREVATPRGRQIVNHKL